MIQRILFYGLVAGLVAGGALSAIVLLAGDHGGSSMALGYLVMLIGLSAIFVGVKQHRDVGGGGVIRFWPAFGMGCAISLVAAVIYAIAWDLSLAASGQDFAASYAQSVVEQKRAAGASAAEVARVTADMAEFRRQYANPLYRLPMTMLEILPVGVLVSLVSAALLRNPRFLPARRAA